MKRSKTIWHRGWVRVRCGECEWLMFRPPAFWKQNNWTGRPKKMEPGDEALINCPKCGKTTYAQLPPEAYDTDWPNHEEGDPRWYEKIVDMINEG